MDGGGRAGCCEETAVSGEDDGLYLRSARELAASRRMCEVEVASSAAAASRKSEEENCGRPLMNARTLSCGGCERARTQPSRLNSLALLQFGNDHVVTFRSLPHVANRELSELRHSAFTCDAAAAEHTS